MSGRSRGRPTKLGCPGGVSLLKYKCKVQGCTVTPRGCDLGRHYSNKTDWQLITNLRDSVGDPKVEKYLAEAADGHTELIYRNSYTTYKLPIFKTRATAKTVSVCQPGQQGISRFLQVFSFK